VLKARWFLLSVCSPACGTSRKEWDEVVIGAVVVWMWVRHSIVKT
jgi:hypothetical protein